MMYIFLLIIFILYIIFTFCPIYKKLSMQSIKRIYYLFAIVWIYFYVNNSNLNNIIPVFIGKNNTSNELLNNIILGVLIFLLFVIWDFIFISCVSINSLAIKGIKLSFKEIQELNHVNESTKKDFDLFQSCLKIQYMMFRNMNTYYKSIKNLSGKAMYRKILNKYSRLRGIDIDIFYNNNGDLKYIKEKYCIDNAIFTHLINHISKNGVYIPDIKEDLMYTEIVTCFTKDNLLLIITGDRLIKNENIIIQNIISYFDKIIEVDAYKQII